MRLTDESPLPRPGGRSPRKRSRRPAFAAPAAPQTQVLRGFGSDPLLLGIFGLIGVTVLVVIGLNRKAPAPDPVLTNPAIVRTGTSSAAMAADEAAHAAERARIEELFGRDFWDVRDKTDFDESPQWRKAVLTLAEMSPEAIAERLSFSLNVHYKEVMADPARFRGRFVRMRGVVATNFRAYKLNEMVGGRTDVYRGWVSDPDPDEPPVAFDVLDRPPRFAMVDKVADIVDVDGVFFRTVQYQSRSGRMVEVPWILARTVSVYTQPATGPSTVQGLAVTISFLALLFGIVYLSRRNRQREAAAVRRPSSFRQALAPPPANEPPAPPTEEKPGP